MNVIPEQPIGQFVLDHPQAADIFESYGIDFCCNGHKSLITACKERQLSLETLIKSLEENGKEGDHQKPSVAEHPDFTSWPLDQLTEYIEQTHHRYVAENLPVIKRYLEKILSVHGKIHPELHEIATLFQESAAELTRHMKKEELILFPFIRKLVRMKDRGELIVDHSAAGAIRQPVKMMLHDHDTEAERFRKMDALTNHYTPPADACSSYQATFSKLQEFERDLHRHIHLENNLLFPKAIAMEQQMIK